MPGPSNRYCFSFEMDSSIPVSIAKRFVGNGMTDSSKAHARIAAIKGLSITDASDYCDSIRDLQEGNRSSDSDIAEALHYLQKKDYSCSDHRVARAATRVTRGLNHTLEDALTQPTDGKIRVGTNTPLIREFQGPNQHEEFVSWLNHNNTDGYVLNLREADRDPMLHSADCPHLRQTPADEEILTGRPKLCARDRNLLKKKGQNIAEETLQYCQHCDG